MLPPYQKSLRGFTLIELLVAISIVAILATIGLISYSGAQRSARDGKRKQDLQAIRSALELYYQKNSRFPCTTSANVSSSSNPWIADNASRCPPTAFPLNSTYINSVPLDPSSNTSNPTLADFTGYFYWSDQPASCSQHTAAGRYYILGAKMENKSNGNWQSDNVLYCNGSPIKNQADLTIAASIKDYIYVVTSE